MCGRVAALRLCIGELPLEALRRAERSDRREAVERLRELREDGRARDGLEALQVMPLERLYVACTQVSGSLEALQGMPLMGLEVSYTQGAGALEALLVWPMRGVVVVVRITE